MRLRIALLALPLALVACGGSSSSSGGSDQSASSTACPKGAVVIHMANIKFAPEKATAKPGQTVCWINDDTVQHDATADGQQFHSALFGKGKTFSWKAVGSGPVKYVCTVHPGMDGEIDVTG
jgi:plastocyanin